MHFTFLGAKLPLTKTFALTQGRLTTAPYPHVSKVTSYHEEAKTLPALLEHLQYHASQNHCLFNGQLTHPLVDESRAGKTQDTLREWVVFDFDKVEGSSAADVVKRYLPAECQSVSYIYQLSASMFRPDTTTWSGHIFMLLKTPIDQQRLKQWFEHLNFSNKTLNAEMSLSDSLQALHWPLDRTVAYNSKLVYIAPPRCHGFEPAVKQHIQLVKKKQTHLEIRDFAPIDTFTIRQKINELRREIGEDEIDYDIGTFEGHEILRKAGHCEVSGMRTSGDHYLRFNLNGGDSYAYFIDLRNPEVVRNFKGEPYLRTAEALPDLYKSLRKAAPNVVAKPPLDDGTEVLAFYATNQGSSIKIGTFNPGDRKLTLNTSNETAARAWRAEYGLVQKEFLPHHDLIFDPASDVQYVPGNTSINQFRSTEYMARAKSVEAASTLADLPPIANKTIRSILGPCSEEVVNHFVNWLAFIFQKRNKTGTAWVLNGVEGTGKGTFLRYFLRPVLGNEHVETVQYSNIKGEFNGFLEKSLLVLIEEADIKSMDNPEDAMAKLKLWITDSPLPIRRMRTDVYEADNYSNFILMTNTKTPATVSGTDRRFNFGERQEVKIFYTPNELKTIFEGAELDAFADVLQRWPVDTIQVTNIIDTEARRDAHEATTTINQLIAEAIQRGDLQFFIERMPSDAEAASDFFNRFNPIGMFKDQLDTYIEAARKGTPLILSDEQLFTMFRTLIPDTRYFQDSKTWRKRHYKSLGLNVDKQHRDPKDWSKRARGLAVEWQMPDDLSGIETLSDDEKVVNIKKAKKK